MKIKGHDIRIAENRPNEPWPRAIIVDGKRMEFADRWENTPSGQRVFYKAADDTSVYQGFGVLRKDLQRITE